MNCPNKDCKSELLPIYIVDSVNWLDHYECRNAMCMVKRVGLDGREIVPVKPAQPTLDEICNVCANCYEPQAEDKDLRAIRVKVLADNIRQACQDSFRAGEISGMEKAAEVARKLRCGLEFEPAKNWSTIKYRSDVSNAILFDKEQLEKEGV